jgi:putative aldouronate transport system substrate-binding protein
LGWGWEQTYGPSGAFAVLDQYMKKDQLLYDRFVGSPTATMLEKQSILHELEYEAFIKIIMGNSIDGFDEFVEEWRRLGGDQMTAEVNQWAVDNNN